MSEDLTDYLLELGIRVRYLHSEVDTLRRIELLRELRHGRVRRPGRHQPAARGPGPARGVAGVDPRRRQGGLPAQRHVADPDHRPRRPQRVRPGPHVRGHDHAVDGARRSTRPTAAARSRSPTTPSAASTRSHCASGSPTSPTCSTARPKTPRRCSQHAGRRLGTLAVARQVPGRRSPEVARAPQGRSRRGRCRRRRARRRQASTSPRCPARRWPISSSHSNDQMMASARELQFEVAARLRDEISELKKELRGMDAAGVR